MSVAAQLTPNADEVLCKAVFNASKALTLQQKELAKVLGFEPWGLSRLKNKGVLSPHSKQGELALLLIRVYQSVHALAGGDPIWIKHFMRSNNTMTKGIPAEQLQTVSGLYDVLGFVDAMRSKT
ncbi:MAG: DUF2384 domain-containing protein [Glaciecola sp.]|nr:DUF2384 domain-containing protein [Glaciecola sp.]MDG1816813.1 DUF2384 domain-containing protein [Glaciecola sp.]MDG2098571.1 DUF2384 domain-containing protein [Glaciecola sp.]